MNETMKFTFFIRGSYLNSAKIIEDHIKADTQEQAMFKFKNKWGIEGEISQCYWEGEKVSLN